MERAKLAERHADARRDEREVLERRRHRLVVALTFVTGVADAIGFFGLGAFSSVMTGNMVLLGVSFGLRDVSLTLIAGTAIVSYAVGVLVGARIAGRARPEDPVVPRSVGYALALELAVLAAFLGVWLAQPAERNTALDVVLLGLPSAAMGIQGSAVQRFGVPGLSSTYLTGTLTTLISNLGARRPLRTVLPSAWVLCALVVGAGVGAVVTEFASPLAPVLLVVPMAGCVAVALRLSGRGPGGGRDRDG